MNRKKVTVSSIAAVLLLAGCQNEQRASTVALRFAMPPDESRYALAPVDEFGEDLAYDAEAPADQSGAELTETRPASYDEMNALAHAERYHVAMWGNQYQGDDVTYRDLDLAPGDYTFALWEQDPATSVQGNLHVNPPTGALLDVLRRWQAQLPELKQQLAYDAEVQGKANTCPEAFQSFKRQLRAVDRLASKINRAVWWETQWHQRHAPQYEQFLHQAVVLVLPGDERALDTRTKPAFCAADVEHVRTGDPLTKVIVVSDYDTVRWKTRMVDSLWREMVACKNVLWEEVNRYERRKRILDITDHLYKHDKAFVNNEWQLQTSLAAIAVIDEQLADLSERRVALAYAHTLTAPDEAYAALDGEQRDYEQEKVMLTAEKERLDAMWQNAGAETPKRVDLAAARQRYEHALVNVQGRLDSLAESRVALSKLRDASEVLHRSSDARVLAASVVGNDIPFNVRQAIAKESLVTVRLQSQDTLFAPRDSDVAKVRTAAHTAYNP